MIFHRLKDHFPRYLHFDPEVPVYCVTPGVGRVIHRFFDTCPVSPSGRYLALTRFPFEARTPTAGDVAEVVLVDLTNGLEVSVAKTAGWDTQLGAQVQWGSDDTALFFNSMDTRTWRPYGVRYDLTAATSRMLDGTVYHVSPDGSRVLSPCLVRAVHTQRGYGVMAPPGKVPQQRGAPADDGIYITDVESGASRLLVSLQSLVQELGLLKDAAYAGGTFYGFHTRWNPQGDRLMFVMRWGPDRNRRWLRKAKPVSKSEMRKFVLTLTPDGNEVHTAVSAEQWSLGGHHPNWAPDGEHITMNLNLTGTGLRFAQVRFDGSNLKPLHPGITGSGHPSLHPSGRYLLSDAYPKEAISFGDRTVPIRLVDLVTGVERTIIRIGSEPAYVGKRREMRVDPHPVWDRSGQYVIFNACPDGTRRVYIADLTEIIKT